MPHPSLVPATVAKQQTSHAQLAGKEDTRVWPVLPTSAGEPAMWLWISGLVVVATVLRVLALNQQLWFDEIVTLLDSARAPIWQIVTQSGGQTSTCFTLY